MKKILWILMLLTTIFWYSICSADLAWYSILNYNSNYVLDLSWNLAVEELITVDFSEKRHGIYRDIPCKYTNDYITPIKNVNVVWWEFRTSEKWNNFEIKIWDPNKTIKWKRTYSLKYNILWTVRQFDWFQELYWNLLWFEWNTDVNNYVFNLTIPENIEINGKDITVYYWKKWSKKTLTPALSWNNIYLEKPIDLGKNQSVTIVVKFKDWSFKKFVNYTLKPDDDNKSNFNFNITREWLKDAVKKFWLFLLITYIAFTTSLWMYTTIDIPLKYKYNRKFIRKVIYYTPPKWFSAADISLIYSWYKWTERYVLTQIYSWIYDWLLIPETKKNFLWIKHVIYKIDYEKAKQKFWELDQDKNFENTRKNSSVYLEKMLWDTIKVKKWKVITNWTIREKLKKIDGIVKMRFVNIAKKLSDNDYIPDTENKKMKVNLWPFSLWWAIMWITFMVWEYSTWLKWYWIIMWIFAIIVWLIRYIKASKANVTVENYLSKDWWEVVEQVLWFRKYLLGVEDTRLNTLLKEDPNYCEKILPYAIALWIWSKWIKKCKLLNKKIDIDIPDMLYDDSLVYWSQALWALSLVSLDMHLPDTDSSSWSNRWSSSGSSGWYSWGWWGGWWGWSW